MKRFLFLLLVVVLLGGCLRLMQKESISQPPVVGQQNAQQQQVAAQPAVPIPPTQARPPVPSRPFPPEEIAIPKDLPGVEEPEKGIFVIDPLEPQEYLTIQKMKFQRISRDRGELREMTLVFRNIEKQDITPMVRLTFDKADVQGSEQMIEQDFTLPTIPAGMKLVKEFPVSILFSNIERDKTLTLKFYKKYESPRSYYGTHTKKFKPIDHFESLEIKWL